MAFSFPVRVYFSDTDAGGIVYHGRYLDFAEHARTELFRTICQALGDGGEEVSQRELLTKDLAFVVKSIAIDYQSPGFLDDSLVVETSIEDSKRFSVTFLQQVKRDDVVLAELHVKAAAISLEKKRPQPLPQWLLEAISNL